SSIAFECIGSGEECAETRVRRNGVARLFVPLDRLFDARLQQMRTPNSAVEKTDFGVAWTEPDGAFLSRNELLHRPRHELTPAEEGVRVRAVGVEGDHRLVLGDCLLIPVLCAQYLSLGEMCERAAGRCGQGSLNQAFRARYVRRRRSGHKIEDASGELDRQPALRRDGLRVERERLLV